MAGVSVPINANNNKDLSPEMRDFLKFYNNNVPSPIHFPKTFEYLVKLWKYHRGINP